MKKNLQDIKLQETKPKKNNSRKLTLKIMQAVNIICQSVYEDAFEAHLFRCLKKELSESTESVNAKADSDFKNLIIPPCLFTLSNKNISSPDNSSSCKSF